MRQGRKTSCCQRLNPKVVPQLEFEKTRDINVGIVGTGIGGLVAAMHFRYSDVQQTSNLR